MSQPFIARRGPVGGGQGMSTGWDAARGRLEGLPGGGLKIAHEAVDRHVAAGHGVETAIVWLGREGERRVLAPQRPRDLHEADVPMVRANANPQFG